MWESNIVKLNYDKGKRVWAKEKAVNMIYILPNLAQLTYIRFFISYA